ncbi:DNA-binding transcriptional regulator, AcrR family [Gordonia malaquae]|uniref:Putative TetR family transcriptional regulator n=1 Tax=Gordonia malaquae NBRC 108250 TaxID=1223542 RepID=M3UG91_GORML|nr:TetR/AcrR family transcriptional regulator [Gordonia malaquae]GAC78250.1 putative TetR family transcriptional regulator [Gordonia malaquae NBRC 108250]SED99922.1 DNA-binding transcriptional regulator, AcrR family [Gordonia malaquae]
MGREFVVTQPSREPQQDRSRITRERLLSSTLDILAEHGWASATVARVAEEAGVSRGAAQHHFPTKEALITAALEEMFTQLTSMAESRAELPAGPERIRLVVDRAVDIYTGREFKAALQVWAAAASDELLREQITPLEAKFARAAHRMTLNGFDPDGTDPRAFRLAQATLDLARGLGLADTLTDDSKRRAQVVDTWTEQLTTALTLTD